MKIGKKYLKLFKKTMNIHIRGFFEEYGIDAKKEGITIKSNSRDAEYVALAFADRCLKMYKAIMQLEKDGIKTSEKSYIILRDALMYNADFCSQLDDEEFAKELLEDLKLMYMDIVTVIQYRGKKNEELRKAASSGSDGDGDSGLEDGEPIPEGQAGASTEATGHDGN